VKAIKPDRTFESPRMRAAALAVSTDGKMIAASSWERNVAFWNTSTARMVASISGLSLPCRGLAFVSERRALVLTERELRDWEVGTLGAKTNPAVTGIALSPDGRFAVALRRNSPGNDATFTIRETATGKEVGTLPAADRLGLRISFDRSATRMMVVGSKRTVQIVDLPGGKESARIETRSGTNGAMTGCSSPEGDLAYLGFRDGTLHVWDVKAARELRSFASRPGPLWGMACSPDGRYLLTGGYDRIVRLWDTATGRELLWMTAHAHPVTHVAFSPDGRWAFSAAGKGRVHGWDLSEFTKPSPPSPPKPPETPVVVKPKSLTVPVKDPRHLALSADGKLAVVGGTGVYSYDLDGWKLLRPLVSRRLKAAALALTADGKRLVVHKEGNKLLMVLNVESARPLRVLSGGPPDILDIACSPDGRWVVAGGTNGLKTADLTVWDMDSGGRFAPLQGHVGAARELCASPDGNLLASMGVVDRSLRFWYPLEGREVAKITFAKDSPSPRLVGLTERGREAVVRKPDTIEVWDRLSKKKVRSIPIKATAAALDSAGRHLVVASVSGDPRQFHVEVFDIRSGKRLHKLEAPDTRIPAIACARDSRRVVALTADGLLMWDLPEAKEE
jgi:WD40 repeat protein